MAATPVVPVVIDTDPGLDDAIAIMLALASPEVDVLGITTVAGNTTLENTTWNALRLLDTLGIHDIPVAAGADRPLIRPAREAIDHVHGASGVSIDAVRTGRGERMLARPAFPGRRIAQRKPARCAHS